MSTKRTGISGGKLGHAAQVVPPGKTFMRRLFELLRGTKRAHHQLRLNRETRADLFWWASFLETWNGVSMMGTEPSSITPATHIWTDASGQFGCGAIVPSSESWFQLEWPHSYAQEWVRLRDESIALKELLPIVIACAVWGRLWKDSAVVVHCDNMGVVAIVNSGYSRVAPIMHLLRCLFFIRAHFRLNLWAVHVPGTENGLADAISRNHLPLFFSQVPGAAQRRVQIQPELLALLAEQQPDWTSRPWTRLFRSCFPLE